MMHASAGGKDFLPSLNPDSFRTVTAYVEPSLAQAAADDKFQFERHGYFGNGITSLREVRACAAMHKRLVWRIARTIPRVSDLRQTIRTDAHRSIFRDLTASRILPTQKLGFLKH